MIMDWEKMTKINSDMSLDGDYVFFDIETTGFNPLYNKIIEIGAVKISGRRMADRFGTFVNPGNPVPDRIEQLTGINNDMHYECTLHRGSTAGISKIYRSLRNGSA